MATHCGGVSAATGVPLRADMAPTIATPAGICESTLLRNRGGGPAPAQVVQRRKDMQAMLKKRFQQKFGADPVRAALISYEIDQCAALKGGALTRAQQAQHQPLVRPEQRVLHVRGAVQRAAARHRQ